MVKGEKQKKDANDKEILSTKTYLHTTTTELIQNKKSFCCPICGQKIFSHRDIRIHLKNHR